MGPVGRWDTALGDTTVRPAPPPEAGGRSWGLASHVNLASFLQWFWRGESAMVATMD